MSTIEQRLKTKKWDKILDDLNNKGFDIVPNLINDKECAEKLHEFKEEYRFGKGVYKYFNYPLPDILTELRVKTFTTTSPLLRINGWKY